MTFPFKYTDDYAPDSTALSDLTYNQNTEDLLIEFTSGDKFVYYGIPKEMWDEIRSSRSAGSYYHANIRGKYSASRIVDVVDFQWTPVVDLHPVDISVYLITAEVTTTITETVEVTAGINDIHDALSAFAAKYPGAKVKAIAGK